MARLASEDYQTSAYRIPGLSGVAAISARAYTTCALLHIGTVRCFGGNGDGQFGSGYTEERTEIGQAFGVKGAVVVTSYQYGACALLKAGKVKCWGYNEYGMLGFGTESTYNLLPEYVLELSVATSVGMGYYNTCALLKTGQVKC